MDADLVIAGAGSAGAVIASRVTERADRDVLLVEAGPDYPGAVPEDLRDGTRNSTRLHDWGFKFRPTPGQDVWAFPRGRVVGGSSAVNTCIALRGQPYDFDEWAARGLPEWSWDRCLPAFRRLEDDRDFGDAEGHGRGGPLPIRRHPRSELVPWQAAFDDACAELGFAPYPDQNGPAPLGFGPHPMNKIDGERMSAARCWLTPPVRARNNLRIRPETLVRRVLFENRRVTGVEVESGGRVEVIRGKRVVLTAGAMMTPGILLRSGIGPREEVARLGVALVADVPAVGARLLDHPGAAIILAARHYQPTVGTPLLQTVLRYTSRGSALPGDMQLQPGSFVALPMGTVPGISLMCSVGKPSGWGTIRFPSADPRARPRIDGKHLVDPDDLDRAVAAMSLAYDLTKTRAMRGLGHYFWPGERTLRDPEALRAWIWRSCGSGYHPCGTAPMGPEGAVDAAVDQHGRVRGVEGLFVADASIMPTVPCGNIHLPGLMIGERFGEWLRDGVI